MKVCVKKTVLEDRLEEPPGPGSTMRRNARLLLNGTLAAVLVSGPNACGGASATTGENAQAYLFAHFSCRDSACSAGGATAGMRLAVSEDGYVFTAVRDGAPVYAPELDGSRTLRDPSVVLGPDGLFHAVWTSGHLDSFGLAHSEDLLTWSAPERIPVMAGTPGTLNVWAPEIHVDERTSTYAVVWASTVEGRFEETAGSAELGPWNHRLYVSTSTDLEHWSAARLLYDGGFNTIDGVVAPVPGTGGYVLVTKDETFWRIEADGGRTLAPRKTLHVAFGSDLLGPFGEAGPPINPTGPFTEGVLALAGAPLFTEGPSIVRVDDAWVVYYDRYFAGRYGAVRSADLSTWQDVSGTISFPPGSRHGTVLRVPRSRLRHLLPDAK